MQVPAPRVGESVKQTDRLSCETTSILFTVTMTTSHLSTTSCFCANLLIHV